MCFVSFCCLFCLVWFMACHFGGEQIASRINYQRIVSVYWLIYLVFICSSLFVLHLPGLFLCTTGANLFLASPESTERPPGRRLCRSEACRLDRATHAGFEENVAHSTPRRMAVAIFSKEECISTHLTVQCARRDWRGIGYPHRRSFAGRAVGQAKRSAAVPGFGRTRTPLSWP